MAGEPEVPGDRPEVGPFHEPTHLRPGVRPADGQRAVVEREPVSRHGMQDQPGAEPLEEAPLEVVDHDAAAADARQLAQEPDGVVLGEVMQDERRVRDIEGAIGEGQGPAVGNSQGHVVSIPEPRAHPPGRIEDLEAAIDGRHPRGAPWAGCVDDRLRDVRRPGPDVEHAQLIDISPARNRDGSERPDCADRQVRATETPVHSREVPKVAIKRGCVPELPIEELPGGGQTAHARIMQPGTGNSGEIPAVPGPMRRLAPLLAVGLFLAACSFSAGSSPTPAPQPSRGCGQVNLSTDAPAGCAVLSEAQLRLLLLDRLGPRWFCDPDDYPVAVQDEMTRMRERWNDLIADGDAFAAIVAHEGLPGDAKLLTDEQRLKVYRLWKVLNSIQLDPIGNARYRFDYLAQPVAGASDGTRTAGTIDDRGTMNVEQQAASGEPPCPICLSVGTLIDTPDGPIAVERLRLGDPVWTLEADGRRVLGTVIALGSTPAPAGHQVVRLALEDGRTITASPGHPLADGRLLGDLRVGDVVDGSRVVAADLIAYRGEETFDLVASGPTGVYLAGGVPLGSTIR